MDNQNLSNDAIIITTEKVEVDMQEMTAKITFKMPSVFPAISLARGSYFNEAIKHAIKQEEEETKAKCEGFPSLEAKKEYDSWVENSIIFQDYNCEITEQKTIEDRPSFDDIFMEVSSVIAKRGTCSRLQVGAVITVDNKIVSTGYNGAPSGSLHCTEIGCAIEEETGRCKRAVHAEMNALMQIRTNSVFDIMALYTTQFPCIECATVIANSEIDEVHYYRTGHYNDGRTGQAEGILHAAGIATILHER